jgi:hypothetical protein
VAIQTGFANVKNFNLLRAAVQATILKILLEFNHPNDISPSLSNNRSSQLSSCCYFKTIPKNRINLF